MRFRSLTSAFAAAAIAMVTMTGTVQAAEAAKYPDWKARGRAGSRRAPFLSPMVASRLAGSLRTTKPSRGGEDRRPRSLLNIKRCLRKALRTRQPADRAIFL